MKAGGEKGETCLQVEISSIIYTVNVAGLGKFFVQRQFQQYGTYKQQFGIRVHTHPWRPLVGLPGGREKSEE